MPWSWTTVSKCLMPAGQWPKAASGHCLSGGLIELITHAEVEAAADGGLIATSNGESSWLRAFRTELSQAKWG
jgi:hypothetical protein